MTKVDGTEEANRAISEEYGVQGYPSIKYFGDGKFVEDYQSGQRSKQPVLDWIERLSIPAYYDLSAEQFATDINPLLRFVGQPLDQLEDTKVKFKEKNFFLKNKQKNKNKNKTRYLIPFANDFTMSIW